MLEMAWSSPRAIGIDLGTTYSAIACLDDVGRPVTLVNTEGDLLTPSVVLFDNQQVVVGKEALKALATDAQHVAECAKRQLGARTFGKVLGGRRYPPEVIQAWVLDKLRVDAGSQIGDCGQAVVTVPAYFDEVRRKATQDAGFMAGFEVMDIINEPTAAAIAYGHFRGFSRHEHGESGPIHVLVYDLGGGTFDVTVMEINDKDFVTLATDGDVQLGGRDWDQRLMDLVSERFQEKHRLDPREDPNVAGRLWRDCEDAKRTLSSRGKASITCDYRGQAIRTEIPRVLFEEITRDLLDRTHFTTRQSLQATDLSWKDIDHVLMVGGATRMPMIGQMLLELTGRAPEAAVSADEAVAHGAALRAGVLLAEREGQPPGLRITNVNSHSLGVLGIEPMTRRQRNAILIPRNTPLPVTAKRVFKTQKANQRSVLVQIVEGESASPEACSEIGQCVVRDLPCNLPVDTQIDIRFSYQENGRLTVQVHVAGTKKQLQHELSRENSLSVTQLTDWRAHITGTSGDRQDTLALRDEDDFEG